MSLRPSAIPSQAVAGVQSSASHVPTPAWSEGFRKAGYPEHVVRHLSAMADLTKQGRYDRMTDTLRKLTGEVPMNMRDFVHLHVAEFKPRRPAHS